ncbi:hypothetical protein EDB84DRAFT_476132 [Lactarius hengduanensis]|nr:hypothetical protein EDB84DRAFT_476132 [Lactarius hengduanensis]
MLTSRRTRTFEGPGEEGEHEAARPLPFTSTPATAEADELRQVPYLASPSRRCGVCSDGKHRQLPGHRKDDNDDDTFARGTPPCRQRAAFDPNHDNDACDPMTAISADQEALRQRKLQVTCDPNHDDDVAVKQLQWTPSDVTPTWRHRGGARSTNASRNPGATECPTTTRITYRRAALYRHSPVSPLPTMKMGWRGAGVTYTQHTDDFS